MRASKKSSGKTDRDIHVSGAEGLYDGKEITCAATNYIKRAMEHPRGAPDSIVITIEKIKNKPIKARLLDISEERCSNPQSAWSVICRRLKNLGVSRIAISEASKILLSKNTMRGAALISAKKGLRLDPDTQRGVRVSRLGIEKVSAEKLRRKFAASGADIQTVTEALTLASKVASCKDILAEICISDDPDYTTGYVASRSCGYIRIPNIKQLGEKHGGRVFFLCEGADVAETIHYLEKTAVILEAEK